MRRQRRGGWKRRSKMEAGRESLRARAASGRAGRRGPRAGEGGRHGPVRRAATAGRPSVRDLLWARRALCSLHPSRGPRKRCPRPSGLSGAVARKPLWRARARRQARPPPPPPRPGSRDSPAPGPAEAGWRERLPPPCVSAVFRRRRRRRHMTTSSPPPRFLGVAQLDCWPRPLPAGVGQWAGDPGGLGVAARLSRYSPSLLRTGGLRVKRVQARALPR